MRLTLRTLLAYLDDTLDPAQAHDIGHKVAESPVAQELVERIRKVTRRRSLANPPVQGDATKLDPNTVAEYLSDSLSPEQVEEVEQICLEQDVYLAEVVSCHQILTLLVTEQAHVPPTARQRMYRLVKGPESIPLRRPPMPSAVRQKAEFEGGSDETPIRWPWYVAGIVACLLGLTGAIWLALPHLSGNRQTASGTVAPKQPENQPDPAVQPRPAPSTEKTIKSKPNPPAPEPPVRGPLPIKEVSSGGAAKVEAEKKAAKKPDSGAAVQKKPIDQAPADMPSAERREVAQFITPNAVLLRRADAKDRWRKVAKDARIFTSDQLMSLPGYRSELKLDNGLQLFLWGQVPEFIGPPTLESAATLHAPPAGFQMDVTLDRGRLLIANGGNESAKVHLRFRDQIWNLTVQPQTEVIVDLMVTYTGDIRFSKRPGGEDPVSIVALGVRKGRMALQIGFQPAIEMLAPFQPPWLGLDSNNWVNSFAKQPGPALLSWDNKGKAPTTPVRIIDVLPEWRFQMPPMSPFREMAGEMQKTLDDWNRQLTSRKDVDINLALTEAFNEERPAQQRIGAFGLGAIDIIPPLVDALDDEVKPMLRGSAAKALQHWAAREQANDLILYNILIKKRYTEAQADLYMQLLHGLTEADVTNPETYQDLLAWLSADRLSIRELALSYLMRLDPDGIAQAKYNPLADAAARQAAIARWHKRIPAGKLPPKAANPPKGANNSTPR